jgi:hypothetical protein
MHYHSEVAKNIRISGYDLDDTLTPAFFAVNDSGEHVDFTEGWISYKDDLQHQKDLFNHSLDPGNYAAICKSIFPNFENLDSIVISKGAGAFQGSS